MFKNINASPKSTMMFKPNFLEPLKKREVKELSGLGFQALYFEDSPFSNLMEDEFVWEPLMKS